MLEDTLVLRLLEKIEAVSGQLCFGTYGSHHVFSDGRFLEFADELPPAITRLRDLFGRDLPVEAIQRIIPPHANGLAEEVSAVRPYAGKYELSSKTHRCIVDPVYYDYLRMRYPQAHVFCRGENQPVTFAQEGVVRAVLMPIKA